MSKKKKNHDLNAAVRGLLREDHFAEGGTLAAWRGRANVYTDKRKDAAKKACRSWDEE